MLIEKFGWKTFDKTLPEDYKCNPEEVARITIENRSNFVMQSNKGKLEGFLSGKVLYEGLSAETKPKVGDWVKIVKMPNEQRALIDKILPRKSTFFRKEKLESFEKQVLVANIDKTFIIQGLDQDFNIKRLERYMALTTEGGSKSVIVLNKIDLREDFESIKKQVIEKFTDTEVIAISAEEQMNLSELEDNIKPQETIVFIGSSGVGKSTIINYLLGKQTQDTKSVREDDSRGRHTTTKRELFLLPNGGVVIDTPGIREVGMVEVDLLDSNFEDIRTLMRQCKFTKCDHEKTAGCAVIEAIESGNLPKQRYENFLKLSAEARREELKKTVSFSKERKHKQKSLSKHIRKVKKHSKKYYDF